MRMNHRWYGFLGAACLVLACGVATAIVLTFNGSPASAAPTKSQYFARVAAICRAYGPRLDKIPPPIDITIPSEITASVTKVAPILREESAALRRLKPPRELRAKLARWTKLNDESIAKLGDALKAAKQVNLRGIQVAYVSFVVIGAKAQHLGHEIGFPSPPC